MRRAAQYEGIFPIDMDHDRYAVLIETIEAERGNLDGFDIAVATEPGEPAPAYTADTATWAVHSWPAVADVDVMSATIVNGPPD